MWFSAYCHVETYLSRALCTRLLDHVLGKVTHWQYWRGFRLSQSAFCFLPKAAETDRLGEMPAAWELVSRTGS